MPTLHKNRELLKQQSSHVHSIYSYHTHMRGNLRRITFAVHNYSMYNLLN